MIRSTINYLLMFGLFIFAGFVTLAAGIAIALRWIWQGMRGDLPEETQNFSTAAPDFELKRGTLFQAPLDADGKPGEFKPIGTVENLTITFQDETPETMSDDKIKKNLDGIRTLDRLPGAVLIVDPRKEYIAVKEANRLGIPIQTER